MLTQSLLLDWGEDSVVTPKISEILDRILKIEGLDKLMNNTGVTPLHHIGGMGYLPVLDYRNIEKISPTEWNSHGTPLTFLYGRATEGLDLLLSKKYLILIEDSIHGSPLKALSRNKKWRPNIKQLKDSGYPISVDWHTSKKLDEKIINDIKSQSKTLLYLTFQYAPDS